MEDPLGVASPVLDSPKKSQTDQLLERLVLRDPYQDFWSNVILWISLAESLVPLAILVLGLISKSATTGILADGFGYLLATIGAAFGIGFTLLFAITLPVAGLVSAVVGFACKTLKMPANNLPVGTMSGGFVGILLVMPFVFSSQRPLWFLSIPVLLGQAGGAYGAWRTFHRPRRSDSAPVTIRFGIKQLMILTAWLAVLLTLLKLAGLTEWSRLQTLGTFFVLQVAATFAAWMWDRRT